nr:putative ribonuclease H-like domain-containing protein [Tanacetum cinerariifolium]
MHGDQTLDAYLNRAQEYADALAGIDEPVKNKDLVMLVVSGLCEEYNGLKTTITGRQSPTSFSELHALLSDHDYMLGKTQLTAQWSALGIHVSPIAPFGPQAFYDVRLSNNNRDNNNNNYGNHNNSRGYNNNRGRDIGANSHVTPDLEAMYNLEAYYGDDTLHVGNGIQTFSPVVKSTTIQAVLSLMVTNDWPLCQLDIQNAFLHRNLKEQVYMKKPSRFIDPQRPNHVCLLHKSLYGLKHAPRAWFERLSKALFDLGFKCSKTDPSLFIYSRGDTLLYILVYVDDIIVTGNNKVNIDNIICQLGSVFTLKDLGPLNYFLGNPDTSLEAFSDADWDRDSDDLRSTGGFAIYHGSNLIS